LHFMPRVSVIMPCFNHALFVGESIEAVLAQSIADLELIVVDDCSKDDSRLVIEKYLNRDSRVRAIYHDTNLGAARSRNDGIRAAEGAYLAFCDADDVWMPMKLARQLELLEKHPTHDVAYCEAQIIDERGIETGERFSGEFPVPGNGSGMLFHAFCTRNFVNMQTVVLRRECIVDAGYFDERIKWVEDWWFMVKLAYRHSFIYTNEVLAKYRVHPKSTGRVQRGGYKANRIKVLHRTVRNYPGISAKLKSEVYYQIAVALRELGKKKYARRCFIRSMELQRSNLRALCGLLLTLSREGWSPFHFRRSRSAAN
jgi:glycosyltransferase involved in cell wall biosynthesis